MIRVYPTHDDQRQGAAFLLTVYLFALTLLVLGGVGLQRVQTELQSAQVSHDLDQSFHLAEAALDLAVTQSKNASYYDGITYSVSSLPQGTATYKYFTQSAEIVNQTTQQIVRRIEGVGTSPSGRVSTVEAYVTEQGPLSGAWADGPISLAGRVTSNGNSGTFTGNLRSPIGIGWSTKLWRGLDFTGGLQIGQSAKLQPGTQYLTEPRSTLKDGWKTLLGANQPGLTDASGNPIPYNPNCENECGVYLDVGTIGQGIVAQRPPAITGAAYAATMKPIPKVTSPFPAEQCKGKIVQTRPGQVIRIRDRVRQQQGEIPVNDGVNDENVQDLNPGEGITLCLQYVFIEAPGQSEPKLVFDAPATVYVVGGNYQPSIPVDEGPAVAFHAHDTEAVKSDGTLLADGVKIIATEGNKGGIFLDPNRFSGSVYAPQSVVLVGPSVAVDRSRDVQFSSVVGREETFRVHKNTITVDYYTVHKGDQSAQQTKSSLINWYQN